MFYTNVEKNIITRPINKVKIMGIEMGTQGPHNRPTFVPVTNTVYTKTLRPHTLYDGLSVEMSRREHPRIAPFKDDNNITLLLSDRGSDIPKTSGSFHILKNRNISFNILAQATSNINSHYQWKEILLKIEHKGQPITLKAEYVDEDTEFFVFYKEKIYRCGRDIEELRNIYKSIGMVIPFTLTDIGSTIMLEWWRI